jgi:TolA-binding protein
MSFLNGPKKEERVSGMRRFLGIVPITEILLMLLVLSGCATVEKHYPGETTQDPIESFDKGQRLYEDGRYDDAEEYFQRVVDDHPESPLAEVAMFYLGRCYKQKGDYQKAISIYRRLLRKYRRSFWVDTAKEEIEEMESMPRESQ